MGPNSKEAYTLTRTLEDGSHDLKYFSKTFRKDGVNDDLQKDALVPLDDNLIYVCGCVTCLEFSTVGLYCYIEASGDPSEAKSEITCVNGLG
jgi:hypothetical protein